MIIFLNNTLRNVRFLQIVDADWYLEHLKVYKFPEINYAMKASKIDKVTVDEFYNLAITLVSNYIHYQWNQNAFYFKFVTLDARLSTLVHM